MQSRGGVRPVVEDARCWRPEAGWAVLGRRRGPLSPAVLTCGLLEAPSPTFPSVPLFVAGFLVLAHS